MSQDTFGLIIMGSLLMVCSGMVVWAKWREVKDWCSKHGLLRQH
ncbi:hypothetical protein M2401_006812 [Pseudomonas sp. JUb42]|nr:hypothetical protein [Pseudomonas sp. JUb42]MCS3473044.1 hypothetical protein [Pseudomonas sp. JUb42]